MRREPATVACCICGRLGVVLDATERERALQAMLDVALRPTSAECLPEWNVPRPLGWRVGGRGAHLPEGPPVEKKKRVRKQFLLDVN